jgi:hypothetical protein
MAWPPSGHTLWGDIQMIVYFSVVFWLMIHFLIWIGKLSDKWNQQERVKQWEKWRR